MITLGRRREIIQTATSAALTGPHDGLALDIIELIRQHNLRLAFVPLQRLYGAYIPSQSGNAGILIHNRQPRGLQRFTAAHELGHHLLHGGTAALDDSDALFDETSHTSEQEAQLFAGHLLMPLPYIAAAARLANVAHFETLTAEQAYTMAGLLDVSYKAAITQMHVTEMITPTLRNSLLGQRPSDVAQRIAFGEKVAMFTRAWAVRPDTASVASRVGVGDDIAITLPENRTTGYRWFIDSGDAVDIPYDEFTLDASTGADQDGSRRVGAGGERRLIVRPSRRGPWQAHLTYAPVHQREDPAETFTLTGSAVTTPQLEWNTRRIDRFLERTTTTE
ncbi:ImmA/IrrE family metallo-endopeptidase [Curtobacterium luteum]|uniref:ImmA/IrrE family metallo-endopeptidase n=1 Tax=Curtobacterium luteum TaxID=33881 RepID=UPI00382484BB